MIQAFLFIGVLAFGIILIVFSILGLKKIIDYKMSVEKAVHILQQSNFEVKVNYTDEEIREAIKTLNTEGGYTFIRKLDENTNPIL